MGLICLPTKCEHGPDTPAVFITTSEELAKRTMTCITELLKTLSTTALASHSWNTYGEVIVVTTLDEAFEMADIFASEHVQILTRDPRQALSKMSNFGALFLGDKTCVSYGDKVSTLSV